MPQCPLEIISISIIIIIIIIIIIHFAQQFLFAKHYKTDYQPKYTHTMRRFAW